MTVERLFVADGSAIKVYKNNEAPAKNEQTLKHLMNLEAVTDAQGANLHPGKLILHHDETQLLFIDKNNRSRVFCYDLEACKIASEF